jgi:hypothetical protein
MFSTSILAGAAAALLPAAARSQNSVKARNVVLVHGAYADGSSWLEVIPYLQAAGMKATAVQNPLSSLADDVAATKAFWLCRMVLPFSWGILGLAP